MIIFVCLSIFLVGCTTVSPKETSPMTEEVFKSPSREVSDSAGQKGLIPASEKSRESSELKSLQDHELDGYIHKKGVVFAKVEVQGILKTDFINLIIEPKEDPSHQFQLFIGDTLGSKSFPWEGADKNIGHFFIELPKGEYIISFIGIPVGSTMAMEPLNVSFNVIAGQIAYLGTLKLIGTKEKVRLGGVPVIKPGFEYTKEVFDERDEAISTFYNRYPNFKAEIIENLMVVLQE